MDDSIKVLILSILSRPRAPGDPVGASGCLLKHCAPKDLVAAVREVAGKNLLHAVGLEAGTRFPPSYGGEGDDPDHCGIRGAQMVAEGRPTRRRRGLFINVKTMKQRMMDKLGSTMSQGSRATPSRRS